MKRFLFLFAAWVFLSCPLAFAASVPTDPTLSITEITSGLSQPTTMAFIGAQEILMLQNGDGRVRRVIGGVLQSGEVGCCGR